MSVELPEAYILARQMSRELIGKEIASCNLQECQPFQKLGFINKDVSDFNRLCRGKVELVASRGNVIRVKLNNGMNLLLAPEYGGKILYNTKEDTASPKFHLKVHFKDNRP